MIPLYILFCYSSQDRPCMIKRLAVRPTPFHEIEYDSVTVTISRDDLTGSTMSGNKIRKLEFLLADAIQHGYKCVITIGGIQSNHCRATVVAARRCGLTPILLLKTSLKSSELPSEGNVLFDKIFDAKIHTMGDYKSEFTADDVTSVYNKISESENAYQIPVGGSNHLGSWGYIEKWSELMSQGLLTDAKNIFVPTGSGGTAAGIIIGNYLTGNKHHLFLMQVADTVDELRTDINKLVKSFDLPVEEAMKNCQFIPALGEGYALSTNEELSFLKDFAIKTGVLLDRVYSAKAARMMFKFILKEHPRGDSIFLHTGGIHSLSDNLSCNYIHSSFSVSN